MSTAAVLLVVVALALSICPPLLAASITRVSVASNGTQGNGESNWSAMSSNGRYVAFDSSASNLVAGDTNGYLDVFVHDRQTGQTERVSVASDGTEANLDSGSPAISADGQYVVFVSDASNLVSGDTNGYRDVFVHDRETGQTERVSVASNGAQGNSWSGWPVAISADGRYVAWVAAASNLVSGDTNGAEDVFVRDRQTNQTQRVSVASNGTQGNDLSYNPTMSADGRYVAFHSVADNLVLGDTNGYFDVFVHDRQTGQTERVSVASDGTEGNWHSGDLYVSPSISADGRYVAFHSGADNLVPDDTNAVFDVFVHDRQTGETERVSVASDGSEGTWAALFASYHQAISGDGRYVVFRSECPDLVPGDTNVYPDVFVHDRQTGETKRVSVASDGSEGDNGVSDWVAISADGRHVSFPSWASNLVADDTNDTCDVFVRDRLTEAGFYGSLNTRGKAPLLVTFTDLSALTPSGPALAWDWDFGDGGSSTEENPTHEYTDPGVYTVTLTATCAEGPLTTIKQRYITVSFSDVAICPVDPADYWALNQILACVGAGIVGGYPEGDYRPTLSVDRSQMAVFIARALAGGDEHVPTGPATATFTDVPTGYWAFKYVEYTYDNDIVQGYGAGVYSPTAPVDRAQMAVFVARAIVTPTDRPDLLSYTPPETATFTDVGTGYWAYKYIEYIAQDSVAVSQGYDDGTYRPETVVTRDQMAVYVQRAFKLPM